MKHTESLHIGYIAPFLFRLHRGIERSCLHLAGELAGMGQRVTIMAWNEPNGTPAAPLDSRVRVVRVPYFRYYRSSWAIPFYLSELLTHHYDVINIFFAGYGEAEAIVLARRLRHFQLTFIAGYPIQQAPHRFEEFRHWKLNRFIDRVIVKSSSMAPAVAQYFDRSVDTVPNGIDVDLFSPEGKHRPPAEGVPLPQAGECIVLTIAALEERKGIQHVIRVLPHLLRLGLSVRYIVVGDGPHRSALEAAASEHAVASRVNFVGAVTDVIPYYQLADLFVLLSYGEGFPNALLEAWAMSLPVIVSQHPPYPSVVLEGLGFTIDENDTPSLARVMSDLLTHPEARARLGRAGREHVQANYTWPVVARRYMELYRRDLAAHTRD